jgi:hypothetical protein
MIEVATPNIASFGSRLYKHNWLGLDPPRHLVVFSPNALKRALSHVGFVRIKFCVPRRPAAWYFHASEALRRGRDWGEGAPLTPRSRAALAAARVSAQFAPQLAEEVLVTAEKP